MNRIKRKFVIKYSDFISNYFYQQITFLITKSIYKTDITPNQITLLSLLFGFFSAISIYYHQLIIGVIFLNISFIMDCLDGQIARVKNMQSAFGMWLDNTSDRVVENIVILAIIFSNLYSTVLYGGIILLFLNMMYAYMSDMIIYQKRVYPHLTKKEKIIFSPIYFISRSMIIPLLSLLILFPIIFIWVINILYCYGIIFRIYREITLKSAKTDV